MTVGQGDHHALGSEQVAVQVVDERWPADRSVEGAVAHAGDQIGNRQVGGVQFDGWMPFREEADDRRHHLVGQRGEETDAQFEVFAARASADGVHRPLRGAEQRDCLAQQA